MNDNTRYRLVDILNGIIDQAKFIRNNIVHNSPNATIDIDIEIKQLSELVGSLRIKDE